MFCHHCWLFTDWAQIDYGIDKFKKGIGNFQKLEETDMHLNATKIFTLTKYRITKDETVVSGVRRAEEEQIQRNRSHIDRVLYLAQQGMAFRGHRIYAGCGVESSNEGCFIKLIKLLAKYDGLLSEHLNPKSTNYLYLFKGNN